MAPKPKSKPQGKGEAGFPALRRTTQAGISTRSAHGGAALPVPRAGRLCSAGPTDLFEPAGFGFR